MKHTALSYPTQWARIYPPTLMRMYTRSHESLVEDAPSGGQPMVYVAKCTPVERKYSQGKKSRNLQLEENRFF